MIFLFFQTTYPAHQSWKAIKNIWQEFIIRSYCLNIGISADLLESLIFKHLHECHLFFVLQALQWNIHHLLDHMLAFIGPFDDLKHAFCWHNKHLHNNNSSNSNIPVSIPPRSSSARIFGGPSLGDLVVTVASDFGFRGISFKIGGW